MKTKRIFPLWVYAYGYATNEVEKLLKVKSTLSKKEAIKKVVDDMKCIWKFCGKGVK